MADDDHLGGFDPWGLAKPWIAFGMALGLAICFVIYRLAG
jgi:hypothetical protein